MAELHLKGYLCSDSDGIIALNENNPNEVNEQNNKLQKVEENNNQGQ